MMTEPCVAIKIHFEKIDYEPTAIVKKVENSKAEFHFGH